jgi:hypothetical protein
MPGTQTIGRDVARVENCGNFARSVYVMLWLISLSTSLVNNNDLPAQFGNTLKACMSLLEHLVVGVARLDHMLHHFQNLVDRGSIRQLIQSTHLTPTVKTGGVLAHKVDLQEGGLVVSSLEITACKRPNILVNRSTCPWQTDMDN